MIIAISQFTISSRGHILGAREVVALFPAWVRRCVGVVSRRRAEMAASNVRHDRRLFLLIGACDADILGCGAPRRGALPARRNVLNIILAHAHSL